MSARLTRTARPMLAELESRHAPSITPVGPEIQVNTLTTGDQWQPAIASDADGNFLVAFAGFDASLTTDWGVFGRRFAADGTPLGDPFVIAEVPSFFSNEIAVAMTPAGGFVAAWSAVPDIDDPSTFAVSTRWFDAGGVPTGPAVMVHAATTDNCSQPAVGIDAAGNVAVAWTLIPAAGGPSQIMLRQFAADGTSGPEVAVTATPTGNESAAVAVLGSGSAVVVWAGVNGGVWDTFGRVFDSVGQPLGQAFRVVQGLAWGGLPDVAADGMGNFVTAYLANGGVYARRFTSTGTPLGDEVRANGPGGGVSMPAVAADATGRFVVSWTQGPNSPGAASDVWARAFNADGTPDGDAMTINTTLPDSQGLSDVAVDADGDGAIAWRSFNQDGSSWGVFTRRFTGPAPAPLLPVINNGATQRSIVAGASVPFNRAIRADADAVRLSGSAGDFFVGVTATGVTAAGGRLDLSFPDLPDGRYTLRLLASQIHDTAGQPLDGNGDGVPGDDFVMQFHRLRGDFDGDADVDAGDFVVLRFAFGSADLTFDLDGDGDMDARDFATFRGRFGATV